MTVRRKPTGYEFSPLASVSIAVMLTEDMTGIQQHPWSVTASIDDADTTVPTDIANGAGTMVFTGVGGLIQTFSC
jgi:hypothetical protein